MVSRQSQTFVTDSHSFRIPASKGSVQSARTPTPTSNSGQWPKDFEDTYRPTALGSWRLSQPRISTLIHTSDVDGTWVLAVVATKYQHPHTCTLLDVLTALGDWRLSQPSTSPLLAPVLMWTRYQPMDGTKVVLPLSCIQHLLPSIHTNITATSLPVAPQESSPVMVRVQASRVT